MGSMSRLTVGLFDYGAGNLHSLTKAIELADATVRITSDWDVALKQDALILPGVGAFGAAVSALMSDGPVVQEALERGLPCLGICLGMQLLFSSSAEADGVGIGLIPGPVSKLEARRVPHIGWNAVETSDDPIFEGCSDSGHPFVTYFANSFICRPHDPSVEIAWTEYESRKFPAAVRKGRSVGVQFHPEKSSEPGLRLIRNFLREVKQ